MGGARELELEQKVFSGSKSFETITKRGGKQQERE